jgi:nucleoside-diphosphate-sugar epimerase
MSAQQDLNVVVGAGQVGVPLAQRLVARGRRVRVVKRGPPDASLQGVEWARGDVTDRAFTDTVFRGASVVYNCANPANFQWTDLLLPLARSIREAAGRAGARLVVLDSIFMYGRPAGGVLTEDHPHQPCSRKGELRALLARELFDAHARGDVQATAGYAGDFYGPTASSQSPLLGRRFLAALRRGDTVRVFGDPDVPHACAYIPDVAEGLATLGENEKALGRPFHLPTSWNGSIRELMMRFAAAARRPLRLRRTPRAALWLAGLANAPIREALEMLYLWEVPCRLDDRRFVETFGSRATPVERSVRQTLFGEIRSAFIHDGQFAEAAVAHGPGGSDLPVGSP